VRKIKKLLKIIKNEENKDKIKNNKKEYYEENKDKIRISQKEWRENNIEYQKEWHKKNFEKLQEYDKEYKKINKEHYVINVNCILLIIKIIIYVRIVILLNQLEKERKKLKILKSYIDYYTNMKICNNELVFLFY